jgi:YaiO family outer membrane protein
MTRIPGAVRMLPSLMLPSMMLFALFAPLAAASEQEDMIAQARTLATTGRRAEALRLLTERLRAAPADTDARTLYGIVSSWEGRWDEARDQLVQVLTIHPNHGDALTALINVELWSGHATQAESVAREAMQRRPDNAQFVILHARALRALKRDSEARLEIERLLATDPGNKEARDLQDRIEAGQRRWELSADHFYEWFDDGREPWHETSLGVRRQTAIGSIIGRYSTAERFSLHSHQGEIDFYPKFRPGTYAYLNVGYSRDQTLYPHYRIGGDFYQALGHGFEGSGGYRRLQFADATNLYTTALSKYKGSWLFTGRAFLVPSSLGTSHTVLLSARRYFKEGGLYDYFDVRYGFGSFQEELRTTHDIEVLHHNSIRVEVNKMLGRHWSTTLTFGYSNEDRITGTNLNHYLTRASIYFIF